GVAANGTRAAAAAGAVRVRAWATAGWTGTPAVAAGTSGWPSTVTRSVRVPAVRSTTATVLTPASAGPKATRSGGSPSGSSLPTRTAPANDVTGRPRASRTVTCRGTASPAVAGVGVPARVTAVTMPAV